MVTKSRNGTFRIMSGFTFFSLPFLSPLLKSGPTVLASSHPIGFENKSTKQTKTSESELGASVVRYAFCASQSTLSFVVIWLVLVSSKLIIYNKMRLRTDLLHFVFSLCKCAGGEKYFSQKRFLCSSQSQ